MTIPYGYLTECGYTRHVGVAITNDYALELRVVKPEIVLDEIEKGEVGPEDVSAFYFNLFKKSEEFEGDWEYLTYDVPVKNMKDLRKLVKRHGKRRKVPSTIYNSLRASIELNVIGRGNDLENSEQYFLKTKNEKSDKKRIDRAYEEIREKLGPDATLPEMNKYLLETVANELGLPLVVLPNMDVYTSSNRKLTMEDIRDDMDTRNLMMETSPFGPNPEIIDHNIQEGKRKMGLIR